jgi:methionyl-tRNA formyltransferase
VNLVFLGTPEVAVVALRALLEAGHEVSLVVTRPDRPVGRSGRPAPPPVKRAAQELGIDVLQPTSVRGALVQDVARRAPDGLVVVAYGRILPVSLLEIAVHGAVNVHFSLLPKYRGAAPVQWALAHGERVTGVTTMRIAERLDQGDMLLQREVTIGEDERAPQLRGRLAAIGAQLLVETLARQERGTLTPQPQDPARATYAPSLSRADGEIDPAALTAEEIAWRIRGFDPWPGVWVGRAGKRLRFVEARATGGVQDGAAAGSVLGLEDGVVVVACGAGTLLSVSRLQLEGRRELGAREAFNGRCLAAGDRLVWLGQARVAPLPRSG